jgi:hypothetical protein
MFEFSWLWLAMAFCGGVFGAAIGALPSFILCGLAAVIGGGVLLATDGKVNVVDMAVTWGPLVGPQTAFLGGTAAAAYAKKRGKLANGRDILSALMGLNSPDILLVGGIFGMIGALLTLGFSKLPAIGGNPACNAIAVAIALGMIIARLAFGETGFFGKVKPGAHRWTPSDHGCWVPWQSSPLQIILIALAVSLPTAVLAREHPSSGLFIFGLGVVSFVFLQYGTKIPITHHIALITMAATAGTGDILWGVAFGLIAALLCEYAAVIFVYHGDTHIDPPTVAIAACCTLQPILICAGAMAKDQPAWIPLASGAAATACLACGLLWLRHNPTVATIEKEVQDELRNERQ